MTITVFPDLVLTNQAIEGGVKGRQVRKNQRVRTAAGFESINIGPQDRTIREYDIGVGPLRRSAWQQIETMHEITEGGAYGFLLLDPKDFTVGAGEGVMAGPVAGAANTFQLYKRYRWDSLATSVYPAGTPSTRHKDRKITRPVVSSISVEYNGAPATILGTDWTNGRIEVAGATDPSLLSWTGRFYVPVHFLNDSIDWEMVVHGPDHDGRFLSGPMVTLQEVLE